MQPETAWAKSYSLASDKFEAKTNIHIWLYKKSLQEKGKYSVLANFFINTQQNILIKVP